MNIRKVKPNEFQDTFDILKENALWLESKNVFQWPLDWLETIRDEVEESVRLEKFQCAEINKEMAVVVELGGSPEETWGNDLAKAIYIHKLAIRRKFSSAGIGGAMIKAVVELAKVQGARYARLDCVASNTRLRKYYESFGFVLQGETHNGHVDVALYELALEGD